MDERQLPWEDLQVFLATARGGTLAAAAAALGLSSPTVHRRLAALEKRLATRLFSRSPRGYALTAAGDDLLEHVLAIEESVMGAQRRVGGRDRRLSGAVRISTVDDLAVTLLADILRDFARRHEGVRLDVMIDSRTADLSRREADVAIRIGAEPSSGDVIARRVCGVGVALYASRDYLQGHGVPERPDQWGGHRIIRADEGRARLPMEQFLDRHVPGADVVLRSNSMLVRASAVRSGIGLGMLPCFIADEDSRLVRIGGVRSETSSSLWIVLHADLRRNVRVRAFVEHAHRRLLTYRERIEGT